MTYPAGPWRPDPEAVPAELRERPQWVRFTLVPQEGKKPKKIPLRTSGRGAASSTDPSTWGTFGEAHANIGKDGAVGVGYVFTLEDPYVGVDFDDVLEDGRLHPAVAPLVEELATYTEVSPSGRGVKAIGRRDHPLPDDVKHKAPGPVGEIEWYVAERFFTVTGNLLPGAPEDVCPVNGALDSILERYFRKERPPQNVDDDLPAGDELHDDDATELVLRLVSRAAGAIARGEKRHDAIRDKAIFQARHNRVPFEIAGRMLPALLDAANSVPGKEPYPLSQLQRLLRFAWEKMTPGEPWADTKRKLESYNEDESPAGPTWRSMVDVLRAARPRSPISTGFPLLDSTFFGGGLAPGDVVGLGGPPGAGKTTLDCALAANMAGPKTYIGVAAFDEPEEKVAAKIGARFGEAFHRLNADYPSVLEGLEERLAIKDASIEFIDPLGAPDVETILETFAARVPAGRVGILFLDHLHLLTSRDSTERDNEFDTIRRVATAVAVLARKLGLIVVAIAEVLKAASSPDAVRNNPLGAFAGTRKIASLFTVPLVMVPADGGGYELILAKNRLGPRGSAILNVNYETWNVTVDSVRTAGRGTGTLGEESRTATVAKGDDGTVQAFFAESDPMPWADARSALGARGVPKDRALSARRRLSLAGLLVEAPGERPDGSSRGPVPSVWSTPEKLGETRRNSAETRLTAEFLSQKETRRARAPLKARAPSFSGRKPDPEPGSKKLSLRRVSPPRGPAAARAFPEPDDGALRPPGPGEHGRPRLVRGSDRGVRADRATTRRRSSSGGGGASRGKPLMKRWEARGSNPRPPACKPDPEHASFLRQLSNPRIQWVFRGSVRAGVSRDGAKYQRGRRERDHEGRRRVEVWPC